MSLFKSIQKKFFPKKKKSHSPTSRLRTSRSTDWYSKTASEIETEQQLQSLKSQAAVDQYRMMQEQMQQALQSNISRQLMQNQLAQAATSYSGASRLNSPVPDIPKKTVKKPDDKNKKILEQILKHTLDESQ